MCLSTNWCPVTSVYTGPYPYTQIGKFSKSKVDKCIYSVYVGSIVLVTQAVEAAVNALRSHTLNLNPIVDGPLVKVPIPK